MRAGRVNMTIRSEKKTKPGNVAPSRTPPSKPRERMSSIVMVAPKQVGDSRCDSTTTGSERSVHVYLFETDT
jgi:hypothetical protein